MVYCLEEDGEVWGWMRGLHVFWAQGCPVSAVHVSLMTATSLGQLDMK